MTLRSPEAVVSTERRALRTGLLLAVVAFGAAIAVRSALQSWARESGYEHTVLFAASYGVGCVFSAVHAALWWRVGLDRPPAFLLRSHRGRPVFVGAAKPVDFAALPAYTGLAATIVVLSAGAVVLAVSLVAACAALAVLTWIGLFRRPILTLSPEGMAIRWTNGWVQGQIQTVAWDALAPGGPPPPAADAKTIWLLADLVGALAPPGRDPRPVRYSRIRLEARRIFIDPVFLAHAIHYYRADPAARTGIGTREGHDRLTASRRVPGSGPGQQASALPLDP